MLAFCFIRDDGPHTNCLGSNVNLTAFAGGDPGLEYVWTRSDIGVVGTSPTMADSPPVTGIYTYKVVVSVPLGDGITRCVGDPVSHTVTVVDPPVITDMFVERSIARCEPYELLIKAFVDIPGGTYLWSNGATGSDVRVKHGGPYSVTYTIGGCSVTRQINVAKDPEEYIWIFPTGCYTFCSKFESATLLGPSIAQFPEWEWLQDSSTSNSGIDNVAEYDLHNGSHTYNLQLSNGICEVESPLLDVEVIDCECEIKADVKSVTLRLTPYLYYSVKIDFENTTSYPILVSVSVPNHVGILVPGTIIVPPGGLTGEIFELFPDAGFSGGPVAFSFSGRNNEGQLCQGLEIITLSNPHFDVKSTLADTSYGLNKLTAVPNPIMAESTLFFEISSQYMLENTMLEIYDVLGRKLDQYVPKSRKGSWEVDFGSYKAGHYIVVLKQNGVVLEQKNIVVAH